MDASAPPFRSLLYREPALYDLIFPAGDGATARMLEGAIDRYLGGRAQSMLDVGCGSGQHLEAMASVIADRHGADLLESNITYARSVRPGITFHVGDMRRLRLGRRFDLVTCLGNTMSYALTDEDLAETVATFAAHAHEGTLLAADPLNARAYLEGDGFQQRIEGRVDVPGLRATSVSLHELDRGARVLRRRRTWHVESRPDVEDYAEYRLLFPEELRALLAVGGFEVLDVFDNREFRRTELTGRITAGSDVGGLRGRKLYVFARKVTPR
jgi:SAM-dependent methyltransferase